MNLKTWLKSFLKHALIPYFTNPGGFNVDAILILIGAIVWGICVVQAQATGGLVIPEVTEIGKACIFVGIGRASKTSNGETKKLTHEHRG